jgi:hypothetical protein
VEKDERGDYLGDPGCLSIDEMPQFNFMRPTEVTLTTWLMGV